MNERKGEKEDERLEMRALPSVAVCFPLVFAWLPGARAQQCSESGDGTCSAPRRPAGVSHWLRCERDSPALDLCQDNSDDEVIFQSAGQAFW